MDVLPEKCLRISFGGLAESKMKMPLHKIFPMARPTEARDGEIIGGRHRELSAI
jgi:hypothetical protein